MSLLNRLVVATLPFVPKPVVGRVSRRYIAGTTLDDAVKQIKSLNSSGFSTTTDLLGEYITKIEEASANEQTIETIFRTISGASLKSSVSIKLSQMGLLFNQEACYRNVRKLAEVAHDLGNKMTLDMEDSSTVGATWDIYYRLRSEGFSNIGVVAQAYLHRVESDMVRLVRSGGGEVRLCKGIYIEPVSIAYQFREDIRRNFLRVLDVLLDGGCFVGIATHDDVLIDQSANAASKRGLASDRYEFQMLLGVREPLRDATQRAGHAMRVYVPFGEHWYAYSVRRLRENPQIAGYVFKAMLDRMVGRS